MAGVGGIIVTAAGMFAATNVDNAVALAALNIAHRSGGAPTRTAIWTGQFIGMGLIVVVALLAAFGLSFVPLKWVGLLGVIPLARGIALLVSAVWSRDGEGDAPVLASGLGSVIAVTFANGGDNIALYTPAFRVMAPADTAVTIVVFAVAVALWCTGAELLISQRIRPVRGGLSPSIEAAAGPQDIGLDLRCQSEDVGCRPSASMESGRRVFDDL